MLSDFYSLNRLQQFDECLKLMLLPLNVSFSFALVQWLLVSTTLHVYNALML